MADQTDHNETELKFELDSRAASKVRRHGLLAGSDGKEQSQQTVYFDTPKGKLHKKGYSLRVRRVGDDFTQTVKTDGGGSAGLFDRGEWESPVEELAPDPEALKRTPLRRLKDIDRKVEPVVCSDVDRRSWLVDRDNSVVEAVLDSGRVEAGGNRSSFHELELELRGGQPSAMFDIAQELGKEVPLHIGVLSKEERGLRLADDRDGHAEKATAPAVRKTMDAGQAFALVVQECIRHFRLNEPLIIDERDPEALHQARVAMRRLRTAFSLFGPAIRQGSLAPLKKELSDLLEPMGDARNLDVFLDKHGPDLGWRDRRKLRSAKAKAYDQIVETLESQRARDLLLDLVEWTASEAWRNRTASVPIRKFAAGRLDSLWRKVKRKGAKLSDLNRRQLHRLRITVKKLRYDVEFLAPLYPRKRVRKFVKSLEGMQDCLGLVHDDMVSRQIVADFGLREAGRTNVAERSRQVKAAGARFKRLKRIGRIWVS